MNTLRYLWHHPLTRRNRIKAYVRCFRWQLGSRILNKPILMPFIDDVHFIAERGETGLTGNIYCGLHEFYDMGFLLHYIRKEDLFIDVGANVGSYTLLASGVAESKSIAIEPVGSTFEKLHRNIRVNAIDETVSLHHCAVGSASGTVKFTADCNVYNRVAPESYEGQVIEVPVQTIDSITEKRKFRLMKVDVEGYEIEAIKGASEAIGHGDPAAIIIENNNPKLRDILSSFGFTEATYDPFTRKLSTGAVKKPRFATHNFLWIRDLDFAVNRCKTASAISIFGETV